MTHAHVRSSRVRLSAAAVLSAAVVAGLPSLAHAATGSLSGSLFHDLNRNGVMDAGDTGWSGVVLHLLDGNGTDLAQATTAANGGFAFAGVSDGSYSVVLDPSTWMSDRESWVQTSGRLDNATPVTVAGATQAALAWRPVVRSTDQAAPISAYTGPEGLKVASYNDVVSASSLYQVLATGTLGGAAPRTRVNFGLGSFGNCPVSVAEQNGTYSGFSAVCSITYSSWLDNGPQELVHEYGHAWSLYNAYMLQQDPSMAGYVAARGLTGDARLNSTYQWAVTEMVAEDYRQLLGAPAARTQSQINYDIPLASQVAGLGNYLSTTFSTAPAGSGSTPPPAPAPAPSLTGVAMNPTDVTTSGNALFTISASGSVTATVLDNRNRPVVTLLNGATRPSGSNSVSWNRRTSANKPARAGSYVLKVVAVVGGTTLTQTSAFTVS